MRHETILISISTILSCMINLEFDHSVLIILNSRKLVMQLIILVGSKLTNKLN